MESLTEQESVDQLKRIVPKGKDFGCAVIQRNLGIGYCAAWRILNFAVQSGQAYYETETRIVFK